MIKTNTLEIKVCIRNITKFNEKWFTLPISETAINQFLNNGKHEYIIVDYTSPFKISEYANINQLNDIYNDLLESEIDFETIDILFKCSTLSKEETLQEIINQDYILSEVYFENEKSFIDNSDCAMYLYDNDFISFLGEIPENLYDYIDWESVWRECEIAYNWKMHYENGNTYVVNI